MDFHIIIPARFQSTRLPGKVLLDIAGKPMIEWVYEKAQSSGAASITVATDDDRIKAAVEAFGGKVIMTDVEHLSGTDRSAEAAKILGFEDQDIIVSLQGDEPLMPASVIQQVVADLKKSQQASMATLCEAIAHPDEIFDPNIVKVVLDIHGYALYFSRAPIPWVQGLFGLGEIKSTISLHHLRHIGLYAYRMKFLQEYVNWPVCPIEESESLEQLRVLWHGHKIKVEQAAENTFAGVDTPEDLARLREYMEAKIQE